MASGRPGNWTAAVCQRRRRKPLVKDISPSMSTRSRGAAPVKRLSGVGPYRDGLPMPYREIATFIDFVSAARLKTS